MPSGTDETSTLSLRALIIFCALLSLCVSDNVGPRLLPLPPVSELASASVWPDRGHSTSRAPSHSRPGGARVDMVSAPQSRAGAGSQSPQEAANTPKFELIAPTAPRRLKREVHPPSAECSAPFARPLGRAPPRLV
jgi:hypothetical protein